MVRPVQINAVNVIGSFSAPPVVEEVVKIESIKGIPMYGDALSFGIGSYDAAHNIGTGVKVTEPSYIKQVRYYVPDNFFTTYGIDSYTFNFQFKLWNQSTGTYIAGETIRRTLNTTGWHNFTLTNPWAIDADVSYVVSVYKGVNGYVTAVPASNIVLGEGFEIPASYIGAWNNDVNNIPTNSQNLNFNWGVDVVRIPREASTEGDLLGTPMIGASLDATLTSVGMGTDAGMNVAQFFKANKPGRIVQVRYFFPNGFISTYGTNGMYSDNFVITVWERGSQTLQASETISANITEDGWHTFTLQNILKEMRLLPSLRQARSTE